MRLLVAVKSCERDKLRGDHEVIRDTWGKDAWHAPADLGFFYGADENSTQHSQSDEFPMFGIPDDYESLPHKTRAILTYSVGQDYDFTFLCDNDTYVIPDLLLKTGFEKYDIAGRFGDQPAIGSTFRYRDKYGEYPECHPWPSGGVGYFLSKRAALAIAYTDPMVWAEDMYVGQVIGPSIQKGEMTGKNLENFEGTVAWHFPRREYGNKPYDPSTGWMEKMHREKK